MPAVHLNQCKHNLDFHKSICDNFPDKYYDWKITVLFYCAIHYVKAYFKSKNIDIGDSHFDIENAISPRRTHAPYKVSGTCWTNYNRLFTYSRTARYDGVADFVTFEASLKRDYEQSLEHLEIVKKYIIGQGFKLD